jgi:hypothetical protein
MVEAGFSDSNGRFSYLGQHQKSRKGGRARQWWWEGEGKQAVEDGFADLIVQNFGRDMWALNFRK